MPDDQALLSAVIASPDNDEPRLAYAAWLESQDDPRGEFIRISCQANDAEIEEGPMRGRLEQLLAQNGKQWQAELSPSIQSCQFSRGFIETIVIDAETFAAEFPQLAARSPISKVMFASKVIFAEERPVSNWGSRVREMEELSRISSIDLHCELGFQDLEALLTSPHLSSLRKLAIGDNNCSESTADVVASCANLSQLASLEFLGFEGDGIHDAGVEALASAPHLGTLRHLDLRENALGPAAMEALADSIYIRELNSLYLGDGFYTCNTVGTSGAIAIARSSNFSKLKHLDANFNRIGDEGLGAILESRSIGPLSRLSVVSNDLTHASMQRIVDAQFCRSLQYLDVGCNDIGDEGIFALARSDLRNLHTLALMGVKMTTRGLLSLLSANWFQKLTLLRISGDEVGEAGLTALALMKYELPATLRIMVGGHSCQRHLAALKQALGERVVLERIVLPSLGQALGSAFFQD